MDVKDIMGIKGEGKATAKKSKGPAEKKPEGVSREVWRIRRMKQSGTRSRRSSRASAPG